MEIFELSDSSSLLSSLEPNSNYLSGNNQLSGDLNLIFIDGNIGNYQNLIQGIKGNDTEVFVLDTSENGILQISETLSHYQNLKSVQIISHGDVGEIQLGSSQLNRETLNQYQDQLSGWSEALAKDGDLLFYGCNVAKGAEGLAFIETIRDITGIDLAASDDLTGSSQLDGDWELEVTRGLIEASLPLSVVVSENFESVLYTFTRSLYTAADVMDFTDFGYTYDYGYHNDFDNLPISAANTSGLSVRKNAADLTQTEINKFINAITTLKNTIETTANGIKISIYDQFVATHFATRDAQGRPGPDGRSLVNPAHGGSAFLPWHRTLLSEFEEALQSVDPTVTIPYWDWTDADATFNTIFTDNFMGPDGTGGRSGTEVMTGHFSLANGWTLRRDLTGGRWTGLNSTPVALTRDFGARVSTLGTVAQVDNTLAATTYTTFRSQLEAGTGMHNMTHAWVGGIMNNVAGSPNDPMFWLLHANVDRIWAEWQLNNHWGTSFYPASGQRYGHNLNDPMFPWDNGVIQIAADLQDLLPNLPSTPSSTVVSGSQTIEGTLENTGVVSPGNSPGILKINGDYLQSEDGELTIEITGRKAGKKYDVLEIAGTASLDGALNIYFADGFAPKAGDRFQFLKAAGITGDFDTINIYGLKQSHNFELVFKGGSYQLKVLERHEEGHHQVNHTENHHGRQFTAGGFATTREELLADTDVSLYNPSFGEDIGHYLYGYGVHHGWGDESVEHAEMNGNDTVDHSGMEHSEDCDWYLPLYVDEVKLFERVLSGKFVPERLLGPGDDCSCDGDDPDHEHGDDGNDPEHGDHGNDPGLDDHNHGNGNDTKCPINPSSICSCNKKKDSKEDHHDNNDRNNLDQHKEQLLDIKAINWVINHHHDSDWDLPEKVNEIKSFERGLNGNEGSRCLLNPGSICSCIKDRHSEDEEHNHKDNASSNKFKELLFDVDDTPLLSPLPVLFNFSDSFSQKINP
jgi:tyrosinase